MGDYRCCSGLPADKQMLQNDYRLGYSAFHGKGGWLRVSSDNLLASHYHLRLDRSSAIAFPSCGRCFALVFRYVDYCHTTGSPKCRRAIRSACRHVNPWRCIKCAICLSPLMMLPLDPAHISGQRVYPKPSPACGPIIFINRHIDRHPEVMAQD